MRLARVFGDGLESDLAFYKDDGILRLAGIQVVHRRLAYSAAPLYPPLTNNTLDYLPPLGIGYEQALFLEDLGESLLALAADAASEEVGSEEPDEHDSPLIPHERALLDIPVPMPKKVICLAGNYAEHIAEGGGKVARKDKTFPFFFMKPPTTTIRPSGAAVALPQCSPDFIDWEVELVVVIGKHVKMADPDEAAEAIAGYTVGLDMSNRRLRLNPKREKQSRAEFHEWLCGKWHDGFAPIGPCVVAADQYFDPMNAGIRLSVNGQLMQESNTSNMIFDVFELVSYASSIMTLEPGDLIMTGTPSGVGDSRGIYLKRGDVIEATIDGIGTLKAPIG